MNRSIDLMPRTCRDVLGRRVLVRRWGLAYALAFTLLFAGSSTLIVGNRALERRRASLSQQVRENWSRNEKVSALLAEIGIVEQSVTRYNRLAWPVHATDVVNAVAECLPAGPVALTELSITPREERGAQRGKASTQPAPSSAEGPRTLMIIEIEGIATSDAPVAQFVSGLDSNPLFTRVALDFTRATTLGEQEVRNFRVTGEIDLNARYSFVDASTSLATDGDAGGAEQGSTP